jgi:hypothetical protein
VEGNTFNDTVSGDDVIEAHEDAGKDTIDCGDGIDSARFDAGVDVVADTCERSPRPSRAASRSGSRSPPRATPRTATPGSR